MCLAVPGKIIEISGSTARVDIEGLVTKACISLLPEVEVGDYVIVHAGFAIERYDEEAARETLQLLRELADANSR
jgi:hydrogenase expression/formation protein HypC